MATATRLHWSQQASPFYTFLSFIKGHQVPAFFIVCIDDAWPALLFLAFAENIKGRLSKIISVYGRVPMFYYVLHIFLIHLSTMVAAELFTDFSWKVWILKEPLWFTETLKGYGFSLGIVYLVWLAIVIGMYPLCKWYDRYKQNHKEKWWLSYL